MGAKFWYGIVYKHLYLGTSYIKHMYMPKDFMVYKNKCLTICRALMFCTVIKHVIKTYFLFLYHTRRISFKYSNQQGGIF